MRMVVLYVTGDDGVEAVWQPPIDRYLSRRVNAECRARG